jgi:tagatose-6-phosphate ketose/aldose isomerase
MLLSNDSYTRKYDIDLLRELRSDQTALCVMAVTAQDDEVCLHPDHFLIEDMSDASDLELCLPMLLFAQVFALLRSLALSIHTDTPNPSGTVNRVVRGVTIHPLE